MLIYILWTDSFLFVKKPPVMKGSSVFINFHLKAKLGMINWLCHGIVFGTMSQSNILFWSKSTCCHPVMALKELP